MANLEQGLGFGAALASLDGPSLACRGRMLGRPAEELLLLAALSSHITAVTVYKISCDGFLTSERYSAQFGFLGKDRMRETRWKA